MFRVRYDFKQVIDGEFDHSSIDLEEFDTHEDALAYMNQQLRGGDDCQLDDGDQIYIEDEDGNFYECVVFEE